MDIRKIYAIWKKQIKDTLKNKEILIQFVMFPVLAAIMTNSINIDGMPKNYFVSLFATMYIGMAPLTAMAAIISEEKERGTLRVLLMSNVKAGEYLIGAGGYVLMICTFGALFFGMIGGFRGAELAGFVLAMCVGILISLLLGAAIGVKSRSQMAATSIAVPTMMVLSFLPMLASFNDKVAKVSKYIFSQQCNKIMEGIGVHGAGTQSIVIIGINFLLVIVLFVFLYRKYGLE
ncbi:ABC transporter permease [Blautia schinkii]|nr:ABC transporter permease [Blautia schinkii]